MRRIAQLRDRFEDLQHHGLDVIVVLCQKRAAVAAWLVKHEIPFPILIDQDRTRAKLWGVYTLLSYDAIHLARPAAFVVDPAGILRYARFSRHQMDAAPIEEILAARTVVSPMYPDRTR